MLKIRRSQMRALSRHVEEQFEKQLLADLRSDFPEEFGGSGDADIIELIRDGVERAQNYGFNSEHDITRYIYLMVNLGPNFDRDPEFRWAADILRDSSYSDPTNKMDTLMELAEEMSKEEAPRPDEMMEDYL